LLLELGCKVIIAAEGAQEKLLKTEFPDLVFVNLPGYRIKYSSSKRIFSIKIVLQLPKIFQAIKKENKWLKKFYSNNPVNAVISDNRYGFYFTGIPCVFITHQLFIKAPFRAAEKLLQRLSYSFIKHFTTCWIPDEKGAVNLAGRLSHPTKLPLIPVEYLGGLSRLVPLAPLTTNYQLLIIISGPEPQRSLLEKKMLSQLRGYEGRVLFIRGLPGSREILQHNQNITILNHLPAKELALAFCSCDLIISRSGYTTIMDILKLKKKSVLIPTPGQTEQEYLAKHLEEQGWCVAANQQDLDLKNLLQRVQHFEYKLPQLNMDSYKSVVREFVEHL
jgi:uncharacterized protein (TIGR00661 family)